MRYLLAIFFVLSVVLGFGVYYYHNRANSYCELWKSATANVNYLVKQREKDYAKALEASKRQEELEEAVKQSKESCWNRVIPDNDSVLIRVRQ